MIFEDVPEPILKFLRENPPIPKSREPSPPSDSDTALTPSASSSSEEASSLNTTSTSSVPKSLQKRKHPGTFSPASFRSNQYGRANKPLLSYIIPPNVKARDGVYPTCYHWHLLGELGFDVWVGMDGTFSRDPPEGLTEEEAKAEGPAKRARTQ